MPEQKMDPQFSKLVNIESVGEKDAIILVVGQSGVGKSTFINTVIGRSVLSVGQALRPETREMTHVEARNAEQQRFIFVEVPGFDSDKDDVIEKKLKDWLEKISFKNLRVSGIFYLHRITDDRLSSPPIRHLSLMQTLCEKSIKSFPNRLALVTTMWGTIKSKHVLESREKKLQRYWDDLPWVKESTGSKVLRFEGSHENAGSIISALMADQSSLHSTSGTTDAKLANDNSIRTNAEREHKNRIEKLQYELAKYECQRREEKVRETERLTQAQAEIEKLTEKLRVVERERNEEREERRRQAQAKRDIMDELEKLKIVERTREVERAKERAREVGRWREAQAQRETLRWAFYRILALHFEQPSTTRGLSKVSPGTDAQAVVDDLSDLLNHNTLQSDERKRALHLLCKICKSAQVFPKGMQLAGVECDLSQPVNQLGGFGVIYKGKYQEETVCIKAVRLYSGSADERFLRAHAGELVLGAHVLHPNVLPFYGAFLSSESTQRICIVSPWMEGGNLMDYIKTHAEIPAVPLVSDILSGLHHLHEMAIVHADLKGTNVLISRTQRAMLADFGISRVAITNVGATVNSQSGGTTNWMAPELLTAEKPTPAARESDIWAFGCVCYEILAREIPFKEYEYPIQLIRAFMLGTANLLKPKSSPGILHIEEIWSVAEMCMQYNPSERPTAGEALKIVLSFNMKDERPLVDADPLKMVSKRRRSTTELDYDTLLLTFNGSINLKSH